MAGYSSTPLAKKLGIKAGNKIKLINAPEYYFELFADLPDDMDYDKSHKFYDLVHFFTKDSKELNRVLSQLKKDILQNGIIWISWPKKSAKVATDVTEDMIRDVALKNGLVDIKVCAVDEIWSGLKMVIPLKDRVK